jgi:hypothetical protein
MNLPALSNQWQWNRYKMLGSSSFLLFKLKAVADFGVGLGPYENNHAIDMYYAVLFGAGTNTLGKIR